MAFGLKNAFNKLVAEPGNKLNKTINSVVGKEVFGEIRQFEDAREFAAFDSFPQYSIPEPAQWSTCHGENRVFLLNGNRVSVDATLDSCIRYRPLFRQTANYYTKKFIFRYNSCVTDFDSLLHFFTDMYNEGLNAMLERAYNLLLPYGVYTVNYDEFYQSHITAYNAAIKSYNTMAGIEDSKNQNAQALGDIVGNSVQLQGGGFGLAGAAKGIASAELFNAGLGLLGKYVENQSRMTADEKKQAFEVFKQDVFFSEVFHDYYSTFFTFVQTLADNGILANISTKRTTRIDTMLKNLENPMFPEDKVSAVLVEIISRTPFNRKIYKIMQQKYGETEEVKQLITYFIGK